MSRHAAPPPAGRHGCYVIEWWSKKPLPHYGVALPRAIELTGVRAREAGFLIRSRDGINEHAFAQWELTAASHPPVTPVSNSSSIADRQFANDGADAHPAPRARRACLR